MTTKAPVQPCYKTGQTLSPAVGAATANLTPGSKQLILSNLGTNPCYVQAGTGAITATAADYVVPAGAQVVITKAMSDDKLSHISPLGTTLHVMNGEGF